MKQLLFSVTKKDLRIDTFRAGGPGGQNQNKRDTGVRITHKDSGAVGVSRQFKTQEQNKAAAFKRMVVSPEFKVWHKVETARRMGQVVETEATVDKEMSPRNLRVEYKQNGKWVATQEA